MDENKIVIYQTEDGQTQIDVRLENETVWLTQAQMAELFERTPQNITMHIRNAYNEGELEKESTCKEYLQVKTEGKRKVKRSLSNKRIFPAIDLVLSSTRRDDLLLDETTLNRMWIIRKFIAEMTPVEAMNTIRDRLVSTRSNEEFLMSMNG